MPSFETAQLRDNFYKVEEALQDVLPGSAYAERYMEVGSVGIALTAGVYSDFQDTSIESYTGYPNIFSNRRLHPEAWVKFSELDYEALIGQPEPSELVGPEVISIAKGIRLAKNPNLLSSFDLEITQGAGQVGWAGAVSNAHGAFLSVSGLWEVHDDALARYHMRNYKALAAPEEMKVDQVATELAAEFDGINKRQSGIPVEELTRPEVGVLLNRGTVKRAA